MAKYILSPVATGDIHTAPLLKKSGSAKTKFELDKSESLDQEDMEHLFENGYTSQIIRVEDAPETKVKAVKADPSKVE